MSRNLLSLCLVIKVRVGFVLMLALLGSALAGCDRPTGFLPGPNEQDVVLSDKPMMLGANVARFPADKPLKVLGVTSDLCVTLSNDAPEVDDIDAEYEKLKGGAHLLAVLHARDGKDYPWKCGGWRFSPNGSGRGTMAACLKWECNQTPPKGTEITSIDLSSDRPLRILGAQWSSTDSFDFMSKPPPDQVAIASAEYRDLEAAFGGKPAWSSSLQPALQVTLSSNRRRTSFSQFNSTLSIRLTNAGIQLQPGPSAYGMGVVTIPTAAVESCSMTCSDNLVRETDLLLSGPGVQLGILNKPDVIDWCWRNRIPMATSASRRSWLYKGKALPAKDSYAKEFESWGAYDHQAQQSCMGY